MNSTIFLPEKIKVGYQKRADTYTKKLAYVIYYDQKGVLRKESSWNGWRDAKIDSSDFENVPTSGFVLNKKVGDYVSDWNHRQAYVRVYDPRDFEFEITIENLLYILENASSIKGKGLEGEFVYGWHGTDLLLVPTSSPDYSEITKFSDMITKPESIRGVDLVLGGTYRTKQNEDWIYLGRFERYNEYTWKNEEGEPQGKYYFFLNGTGYETIKSLSGKIVKTVSLDPAPNYGEIMENLSHRKFYSPIDKEKDEYVPYTEEELGVKFNGGRYTYAFIFYNGKWEDVEIRNYNDGYYIEYRRTGYYGYDSYRNQPNDLGMSYNRTVTLEKLVELFKPSKKLQYLKNGNLFQ
jgi:hypothetical protein